MRSLRLRRDPDQASDPTSLRDLDRPAVARRLRSAAHPRFYAAQVGEPALADDVDAAIAHFVATGLRAGARISGLFNRDVYLQRLEERGLRIDAGVDPFLHWLTIGWEERIVPTVLFDEDFYLNRHPDLAASPDWAFVQYLRAGSYAVGRMPTPFGPNYGGVPAPDARERQDPPFVTGLLHRAADHDLTRTSWLEEGVTAGATKLAALGSDRMRALVAKAAAIEPLIAETPRERWVSWPPHTHPMVVPAARAEEVRRGLPLTRADTVIVVPGGADAGPGLVAVAAALRALEPEATVVVASTDDAAQPHLDDRAVAVDLAGPWTGFGEARRVLGLLDLVRGLRARRLVVAGSAIGWRLLSAYGTTLANEMSLAAVLTEHASSGAGGDDFQSSFDRLDWVVTDTDADRDDLGARYLLPAASRARVLSAGDCASGSLASVAARVVRDG